ncbi:MAG: amidohydrolase family protein [Hyphomonas sp.]|nr:amidohydrolase family protein [Hyphomonas sp.]
MSMLRNARLRSWLLSALAAAAIGSFVAACTHPQPDAPYDIVIEGGRVIDPETGLDAVRNVGIRSGTIARIAGRPLTGDVTIDAHGLVVAPGFIDMHSHALTTPSMRQQAMDGVTTTLELELGSLPVGEAYALLERQGRPINYGFSVSWALARMQVMDGLAADGSTATYQRNVGKPGWRTAADGAQTEQILDLIGQGLDEGGLGIGVMLGYAPATSADEYVAVNRLAAGRGVPTFTHVRYANFAAPGSIFEGLDEFIDVARQTGAHMHFCHINSSSWRNIDEVRAQFEAAQDEGLRISTEAYPYGAGSTTIGAARYDPDNLDRAGIRADDIYMTDTGEWVKDKADLARLRATRPSAIAIFHFLNDANAGDRALLKDALLTRDAAIASDGMPYAVDGKVLDGDIWPIPDTADAHPRVAGTFARVLGTWVRERNAMSLNEAIRRSTLVPAQILEPASAQFARKGRLQEGMDADIVVFDPGTITDRATYEAPYLASEGVRFLLVGGVPLVSDGQLDTSVLPGRPVRR